MVELHVLSLVLGCVGFQALIVSAWNRSGWLHLSRLHEEEELLTPYESKETYLSSEPHTNGSGSVTKDVRPSGWEFKIVRATHDLFRDPSIFRRLCEEEAQAGWILLEKLDDRRVRFKRPVALRDIIKPEVLSFDPYRTHYGTSGQGKNLLTAIAFLTAILLPGYVVYELVTQKLEDSRKAAPEPTPSLAPQPSPEATMPQFDQLPNLNKRRFNSPSPEPSPTTSETELFR